MSKTRWWIGLAVAAALLSGGAAVASKAEKAPGNCCGHCQFPSQAD